MDKDRFYIGWHQPVRGVSGCAMFPRCMISVNRLEKRKSSFPVNEWMMDSGAFTRITSGRGHLSVQEYAEIINRYWRSPEGELVAVVSQDYMCEEFVLQKTGLDIPTHQKLTIERYDELVMELSMTSTQMESTRDWAEYEADFEITEDDLLEAADGTIGPDVYTTPVLQGYEPQDYVRHLQDYDDRIQSGDWVGVGSVCKRNGSPGQVAKVLMVIHAAAKFMGKELKLHGFGIKARSLVDPIVWDLLWSADSQAHGLAGGFKGHKYVDSNNPLKALAYWEAIEPPQQLSIFRQ